MTDANQKLKSFISRIETLEEEKREILQQKKDVMQEAKTDGFDPKVIRQVLKLRKMRPSEREEMDILTETYMDALEEQ